MLSLSALEMRLREFYSPMLIQSIAEKVAEYVHTEGHKGKAFNKEYTEMLGEIYADMYTSSLKVCFYNQDYEFYEVTGQDDEADIS